MNENSTTTVEYRCCEQRNGKRVWRYVGIMPLRGGRRWERSYDAEAHEVGTVLHVTEHVRTWTEKP